MFDEGESDNDSQLSIGSGDAPYEFDETHPDYIQGADFVELQSSGKFMDLCDKVPPLQPKNYSQWAFTFLAYTSNLFDLHRVILGQEQFPQKAENFKNREARRKTYRNRLDVAYKLLRSAIIKGVQSTDPQFGLFTHLLNDTPINRPAKLWSELRKLLHVQGESEKTLAVLKWIDSTNRTDRGAKEELSLEEFTAQHSSKFQSIKATGVRLEDIDSILYLRALPSRFQEVITTFMQQPKSFTRDDVFRAARINEAARLSLKSGGFAYEEARHAIDDKPGDEDALYANGKRKFRGKGNGNDNRKSPVKSSKTRSYNQVLYEHDISKYPNSPTPWERNLTCKNCKIQGHHIRTCSKSKDKDKSKGKGNGKGKGKGKGKGRKPKKPKKSEDSANLAEEYDADSQWHDEDDDSDDDSSDDEDEYQSNAISHANISSSSSSFVSTVIDNETGLYLKPYWQARTYWLFSLSSIFYLLYHW